MYTEATFVTPTGMDAATSDRAQKLLSLEEQVVRLQALLEASRQVHSILSVEDVLEQTAQVLVRELEIEGAVFLAPETGRVMASYGTPDGSAAADGGTRFPLLSRDGRTLAELVVSAGGEGELSLYEQDFIEGLALQAAVALENATYHERDLQWARVQQDLDAARNIQRSLLPKSMPAIEGFSIDGRSTTCYEVGGDYMDTLLLPDGSRLFIVADVAGKGLASAIMAMSFRSTFRSLATQPLALVDVVNRVGQQHWEEGTEARRRYVTAIFLRLRADGDEIEFVNAGHNPALLVMPDGTVKMVEASGTPLGMLPGMQYAAETVAFPAGARVLLYTDGLTEVFRGEEEFGCERLAELFRDADPTHAGRILEMIWERLDSYSIHAPQTDDMTAIAVCHLAHLVHRQENARP
ncbi:MAG TPA: SpoIIE family protein phosphatase [Acidobacteriaceae bacterium]|jgi:serine phosphatase RsbU (regulator of sigma subunit)|nr:SpoIIE family protein phosphatase [Acidobacteriaceae bacterium]